jgi:hypothetical protein
MAAHWAPSSGASHVAIRRRFFMPGNSKRPRHSKADDLAGYLAGNAPLPRAFFSLSNLAAALRTLLDDSDVSQQTIVSRVRHVILNHHLCFDEAETVKRALAARTEAEPLFFALMRVRQARARRAYPPRRR